jgi:hypothetical protein
MCTQAAEISKENSFLFATPKLPCVQHRQNQGHVGTEGTKLHLYISTLLVLVKSCLCAPLEGLRAFHIAYKITHVVRNYLYSETSIYCSLMYRFPGSIVQFLWSLNIPFLI